jgi:uncharacterized protein YecT (DUF1311 family)
MTFSDISPMRIALRSPRAAILIALSLALSCSAYGSDELTWPLSYAGKSTNQFVWDKQVKHLIDSRLPSTLADDVLPSLGGPPDPVVVTAGRYVSVSACRPHDCGDKAFFWIDTHTGAGFGAHDGYRGFWIGSNAFAADRIPAPAMRALLNWLAYDAIQPASVTFVDRDGHATQLDPARFKPPARFAPPPGGPSFDCGAASTTVEHAICANPAVARRDLDLAQLVDGLRHSTATTLAWDELTRIQRAWLTERDRRCASASNIAGCLDQAYRAQTVRLENWMPGQH